MDSNSEDGVDDLVADADRRDAFINVLLQYALDRPLGDFVALREYVDTPRLAELATRTYRQFVRRDQARRLMAEGINSAIESADSLEGTLRDFLPDDLTTQLKALVGREYQANQELIGSMIRHSTMRIVIRNVLQDTLQEFVERTSQWIEESGSIPGMQGAWNLFLGAFGMARSFTKRFSEQYENQIEKRIETFVDDIIDESIEKMVVQFTSPEMVPRLAEWRRDLVDVLLDQPVDRYVEEFRKFQPEESLDDVGEIFLAAAEWERSPELVEAMLVSGLDQIEDRTVGELLELVGFREILEANLADVLNDQVLDFLTSDLYREWDAADSGS